jgi:hypothetical protein
VSNNIYAIYSATDHFTPFYPAKGFFLLQEPFFRAIWGFTPEITPPSLKDVLKNNNIIIDMEFNTSFNTVTFVYNDKLFTRRISGQGLEYYKKLLENVPDENRRF